MALVACAEARLLISILVGLAKRLHSLPPEGPATARTSAEYEMAYYMDLFGVTAPPDPPSSSRWSVALESGMRLRFQSMSAT